MSKRGYLPRYLLIVKKLKAKPYASFEELREYIGESLSRLQDQDEGLQIGFSKRTLQRDIRDIRNLYGIDIEYSATGKGYYILQGDRDTMNFERMMESFDMFHSLKLTREIAPYVLLENRRPMGLENLYGLLHAIQNRKQIKFTYHIFWDDSITTRTVEPYGVKEYRHRWYLIASEGLKKKIKIFALDWLSGLEVTDKSFDFPIGLDLEKKFRYSFGVIDPEDDDPADIVLSFGYFQGKYVKSLPLHHTQKILVDNDKEVRISLKLYITHDFFMELLSFGDSVKVLEPLELAKDVRNVFENALRRYEDPC